MSGRDAEDGLCSAQREPESGYHLVEDQERAVLGAEPPCGLEEALFAGGTTPMFPATGSTMTAANSPLWASKADSSASMSLYGMVTVSAAAAAGTPAEEGDVERRQAGPRVREERVGVPVVASVELQQLVALRVCPCEPQRGHRRLGARAHEPHLLDARDAGADFLGEFQLVFGGRAEARAPRRAADETALSDPGMRVPDDQRPPRADVVDVAGAVGAPDVRALSRAR